MKKLRAHPRLAFMRYDSQQGSTNQDSIECQSVRCLEERKHLWQMKAAIPPLDPNKHVLSIVTCITETKMPGFLDSSYVFTSDDGSQNDLAYN